MNLQGFISSKFPKEEANFYFYRRLEFELRVMISLGSILAHVSPIFAKRAGSKIYRAEPSQVELKNVQLELNPS